VGVQENSIWVRSRTIGNLKRTKGKDFLLFLLVKAIAHWAIAFHPKTDIPLQSVWVGNLEQFTVIGLNPEAAAEFIRLYVGDFLQNEDQS